MNTATAWFRATGTVAAGAAVYVVEGLVHHSAAPRIVNATAACLGALTSLAAFFFHWRNYNLAAAAALEKWHRMTRP